MFDHIHYYFQNKIFEFRENSLILYTINQLGLLDCKINTNVRYSLRAILEIAINDKSVLQKEIAERQEISVNYLDSIIVGLKKCRFIKNFKRMSSGYILTKPIKQISFMKFIEALNLDWNLLIAIALQMSAKGLIAVRRKIIGLI